MDLEHVVSPVPVVLAMRFPVGDWQFWVATLLFVLAAAWLVRGILPIPWLSKRSRKRRGNRKATLTVRGKPLDK